MENSYKLQINSCNFSDQSNSMESIQQKPSVTSDITSADYYFDSYSHFGIIIFSNLQKAFNLFVYNAYLFKGIHEEMLKDEVRTKSYLKAIGTKQEYMFNHKLIYNISLFLS